MKRKKKKIAAVILLAVVAGLIIFSGIKLMQYFEEKNRSKSSLIR